MSRKNVSRRCSTCALNWPDKDRYDPCPVCGGKTWFDRSDLPMTEAEARELAGDSSEAAGSHPVNEGTVMAFRAWLETVSADDFKSHA